MPSVFCDKDLGKLIAAYMELSELGVSCQDSSLEGYTSFPHRCLYLTLRKTLVLFNT